MKRRTSIDSGLQRLRQLPIDISFEQVIDWVYHSPTPQAPSLWRQWWMRWR